MAIPEFQHFMRPTLAVLASGDTLDLMTIRSRVFESMGLSEEDLSEMTPSNSNTRAVDRVNWSLAYLKAAKLLDQPKRGFYYSTDRGKDFFTHAPTPITAADLRQFPEFATFAKGKGQSSGPVVATPELQLSVTPEDALTGSYALIRERLADEVLQQVKAMSPRFFERLIVQLMLKLGYGGPNNEWGQVLGKSGDNGVDGVINQDQLGLDKIYLQAKKYSNGTVSSSEVREFAGALIGKGARKGVFITTSTFSSSAVSYVESLNDYQISLVHGTRLAELMIDHDLGVALAKRYDVKRIDSDFFTDSV